MKLKVCSAMCSNDSCEYHITMYEEQDYSYQDVEDYSDTCVDYQNDYYDSFYNDEEDFYTNGI